MFDFSLKLNLNPVTKNSPITYFMQCANCYHMILSVFLFSIANTGIGNCSYLGRNLVLVFIFQNSNLNVNVKNRTSRFTLKDNVAEPGFLAWSLSRPFTAQNKKIYAK